MKSPEKSPRLLLALFVVGLMAYGLSAAAQDTMQEERTPILLTEDEITWTDGPPSLPPGSKIAVLEGDPKLPGPLTMRIQVPANSVFAPHTHPTDERVTVLSGTLYFGLGERVDESKTKALTPGSFFVIPAGGPMFAFTTEEETVFQLNVEGPWGITYLEDVG
jgi:quercetin dioxygenase-like cupin family protein